MQGQQGRLLGEKIRVACRLKESVKVVYLESMVFQSSLHPTFFMGTNPKRGSPCQRLFDTRLKSPRGNRKDEE